MNVNIRDGGSPQAAIAPVKSGAVMFAAIVLAVTGGVLGAVGGPKSVAGAGLVGLFALAAWRPVFATYIYVATLPFIAGIERGSLVPVMRPNEALLVLVTAGAMAGGYVRAVTGARLHLRLHPWDIPLAAFFLLATVWPIGSMLMRGELPGTADLMATLPTCKLAGLFLLVRITVRNPTQVLWCIRLIVGGAVGIAAIAVLQTLNFGPALALLRVINPDTTIERGGATLANPIATGDYILIGLTLLITSGVRGLRPKWSTVGGSVVLAAGLLAAGQFSTWLGALVICALIFWRVPRARLSALRLAPVLGVAMVVGSPALRGRLGEFTGGSAPQSWRVRWDNLTHLYIPDLLEHGRFLVGVSPNSVVVPPDTWRDVIYLESGYLQLLWIGGVPLLVGFAALSWAVLTSTSRLSARPDGLGACSSALFIAWSMIAVLLILDPHLFMRGPGDLLFTLIGIVTGSALEERALEERTGHAMS
jgi:hypothetical protein